MRRRSHTCLHPLDTVGKVRGNVVLEPGETHDVTTLFLEGKNHLRGRMARLRRFRHATMVARGADLCFLLGQAMRDNNGAKD